MHRSKHAGVEEKVSSGFTGLHAQLYPKQVHYSQKHWVSRQQRLHRVDGEEIASEIPVHADTGEPGTSGLIQPFLVMKQQLFIVTMDPAAQSHTS